MTDSPTSLLVSAALLLFSFGCATAVTVTKEEVPKVVQDFQANVVSHKELSQISLQYMRMHDLDATAAEDPIAFLKSLQQTGDDDRLTKLYTLAEYALMTAVDLDDSESEAAGDWFLAAAEQALPGNLPRGENRSSGLGLPLRAACEISTSWL